MGDFPGNPPTELISIKRKKFLEYESHKFLMKSREQRDPDWVRTNKELEERAWARETLDNPSGLASINLWISDSFDQSPELWQKHLTSLMGKTGFEWTPDAPKTKKRGHAKRVTP